MNELEQQLAELAPAIVFPETPDLGGAVHARLGEPVHRRWWTRRALVLALVVVGVAVGGVFAVPSARTAILEWLGIEGVKIERVDQLPQVPVTTDLDLGRKVSLAEAKRDAGYPVVVPPVRFGRPTVYLRYPPAGYMVSFVYSGPRGVRLILSEFHADFRPFVGKLLRPTTVSEPVQVHGGDGLWLQGVHAVIYEDSGHRFIQDKLRLADRVLLWRYQNLTFRLEGAPTKDAALTLAEAVR